MTVVLSSLSGGRKGKILSHQLFVRFNSVHIGHIVGKF